jgi:hypothetical protein
LEGREVLHYFSAVHISLCPTLKWLATGNVVLEKQLQAAGGLIEGVLISEEAAVLGIAY